MNQRGESIFFGTLFAIVGLLITLLLFIVFVVFPMSMKAEADCLEKGYPKSYVTWKFDTYCSTLDGAVTITIEKIGE